MAGRGDAYEEDGERAERVDRRSTGEDAILPPLPGSPRSDALDGMPPLPDSPRSDALDGSEEGGDRPESSRAGTNTGADGNNDTLVAQAGSPAGGEGHDHMLSSIAAEADDIGYAEPRSDTAGGEAKSEESTVIGGLIAVVNAAAKEEINRLTISRDDAEFKLAQSVAVIDAQRSELAETYAALAEAKALEAELTSKLAESERSRMELDAEREELDEQVSELQAERRSAREVLKSMSDHNAELEGLVGGAEDLKPEALGKVYGDEGSMDDAASATSRRSGVAGDARRRSSALRFGADKISTSNTTAEFMDLQVAMPAGAAALKKFVNFSGNIERLTADTLDITGGENGGDVPMNGLSPTARSSMEDKIRTNS